MTIHCDRQISLKILLTALTTMTGSLWSLSAAAETNFAFYQVTVNSDRDTINPDAELTLREAIALVNNTLDPKDLSQSEQQQISTIKSPQASRIEFDLPAPAKLSYQMFYHRL